MKRSALRIASLAIALLAAAAITPHPAMADDQVPTPDGVCTTCASVRVGLAHVVRGPGAEIADNRFTEITLPTGGFRGFDAHGETRAIDGKTPLDMGAPGRVVLKRGPPGSYDACGQWLNRAERLGTAVLGFVHAETACNYTAGQTHKSMALATSNDDGLSWQNLGQFITGTDRPAAGKNTGEGDCTAVDGHDGYYYAYCFRPRDGGLIVARAPTADPGPGHWKKYFNGQWSQPGLGGDATRLMSGSGASIARWTTTGAFVLTGWIQDGLGLFLSQDHVSFKAMTAPLLVLDPGQWQRPAPSELVAYPVLLDARNGSNQLSNAWMLVYAYWPPGGKNTDKYLVFRDITVSLAAQAQDAQVGVLLARWYSPALHDRWSTTAPVPGASYTLDAQLGYLLTATSLGTPSLELEDCVGGWPGHPDHLLAEKGFCRTHHYQRLRTAGWIYTQPKPGTVSLYRCYNAKEQSHFASNAPDCERLGDRERLLGYALKQ